MGKIYQLYKKTTKKGESPLVSDAIARLLTDPTNIDLQIDVIGNSHLSNWLPNQKKILWESFDKFGNSEWIKRCYERVVKNKADKLALYSLLKCKAHTILQEGKNYNKMVVLTWDVYGSSMYGVGLANYRDGNYRDYLYVGWEKPDDMVTRIEYIENISLTYTNNGNFRLDKINEKCELHGWIWAELPYRYGEVDLFEKSFFMDSTVYKSTGIVDKILIELGL